MDTLNTLFTAEQSYVRESCSSSNTFYVAMVTSAASFSVLLPLGLRLVYLSDICTVYPETAVCTLLRTSREKKKALVAIILYAESVQKSW